MTSSRMALLYSCSEYTWGVLGESVLHFLWIPGHPHRLTLIIFLKVYQNKLLMTIHAVLFISLLMHTSLLMYSNYRLISFRLPQDTPRLLPAGLEFTTAYCFYWQDPEYKGSQFFFSSHGFKKDIHIHVSTTQFTLQPREPNPVKYLLCA